MDITNLILRDHEEQRRMFALLDEIARDDVARLEPIWQRLAVLLEVHADAEERLFYPRLLDVGTGAGDQDSAAGETKDAIRDHNDIRDGLRAADAHHVGSDEWWQSVFQTRKANSDHMGEEEREALADFRRHASRDERDRLGVEFAAYESAHAGGVPRVDEDADSYVVQHR